MDNISCVMFGSCNNKIKDKILDKKICFDCPWNENYKGDRNIENITDKEINL